MRTLFYTKRKELSGGGGALKHVPLKEKLRIFRANELPRDSRCALYQQTAAAICNSIPVLFICLFLASMAASLRNRQVYRVVPIFVKYNHRDIKKKKEKPAMTGRCRKDCNESDRYRCVNLRSGNLCYVLFETLSYIVHFSDGERTWKIKHARRECSRHFEETSYAITRHIPISLDNARVCSHKRK